MRKIKVHILTFLYVLGALIVTKHLYGKGLIEIKPGLKTAFAIFDILAFIGLVWLMWFMIKELSLK